MIIYEVVDYGWLGMVEDVYDINRYDEAIM
jgi:hypothetical protein